MRTAISHVTVTHHRGAAWHAGQITLTVLTGGLWGFRYWYLCARTRRSYTVTRVRQYI